MNINELRKDFPLLNQDKEQIYFDNACNTLRPIQVIDAITDYYKNFPACGNRGKYRIAEKVTESYEEARQIIAKFINAEKKDEIVITRNATESINIVAQGLDLKQGDVVLTTDREHNSNLVPWLRLAKEKGIIHKVVPSNEDNSFNLDTFKNMLDDNVALVAMVYTSNLDGYTIPAEKIIKLAHEKGSKVLLDGAQTVAHKKIDVQNLDVDYFVFSGHKMMGPSGIGALYGKFDLLENLKPFIVGGDTVAYTKYDEYKMLPTPEKFEAGLQDYAGVIGFAEAVRYLEKIDFEKIRFHEAQLNQYITDELLLNKRIKIIGPQDPEQRAGIVSFYIDGVDSHQVAIMLDEMAGIMTRSGQHCVHSWFDAKNIESSVRASLYFYNTMEEAGVFTDTISKILKVL